MVYPASHYVTSKDRLDEAISQIRDEMHWRVDIFRRKKNFLKPKGWNKAHCLISR
jgi:excinuclease ABC subunit B